MNSTKAWQASNLKNRSTSPLRTIPIQTCPPLLPGRLAKYLFPSDHAAHHDSLAPLVLVLYCCIICAFLPAAGEYAHYGRTQPPDWRNTVARPGRRGRRNCLLSCAVLTGAPLSDSRELPATPPAEHQLYLDADHAAAMRASLSDRRAYTTDAPLSRFDPAATFGCSPAPASRLPIGKCCCPTADTPDRIRRATGRLGG